MQRAHGVCPTYEAQFIGDDLHPHLAVLIRQPNPRGGCAVIKLSASRKSHQPSRRGGWELGEVRDTSLTTISTHLILLQTLWVETTKIKESIF